MSKKKARVVVSRVISSAERHTYTPAYELLPSGAVSAPAVLPAGTVLEIVSIPSKGTK